jgi:hypothetical protein
LRIYAPTKAQYYVWGSVQLFAGLLFLAGIYAAGRRVAQRYDRLSAFHYWSKQAVLSALVVLVIGGGAGLTQIQLFYFLDAPLAEPIRQEPLDDVAANMTAQLETSYQDNVNTVCHRSFNGTNCTLSAMKQQLEERNVSTYGDHLASDDVAAYVIDAALLAHLSQYRSVLDIDTEPTYDSLASKPVIAAFQIANTATVTSWGRSTATNVTAQCETASVSPETCLSYIKQELYTTADNTSYTADTECESLTFSTDMQRINEDAVTSWEQEQSLVTAFRTLYVTTPNLNENRAILERCNDLGNDRMTSVQSVLKIAQTLSLAAVYTSDMTTETQQHVSTIRQRIDERVPQ